MSLKTHDSPNPCIYRCGKKTDPKNDAVRNARKESGRNKMPIGPALLSSPGYVTSQPSCQWHKNIMGSGIHALEGEGGAFSQKKY
jgi:hypothetical protein